MIELGYLIIALPFLVIYLCIGMIDGFKVATGVFSIGILTMICLALGISMITGGLG